MPRRPLVWILSVAVALGTILTAPTHSNQVGGSPSRALAVTDGFYEPSDNHDFVSLPLFDSATTGLWPCQSDAARRNLSEVNNYVRSLGEGSGTSYPVGERGCQLINNSAQGTSWYGWAYPDTASGAADFNGGGSGTGDPRHPAICTQPFAVPMGAGKVRIVGELEKTATGLPFTGTVTLSAKPGVCVSEGTLASYQIVDIPSTKDAVTKSFDVVVDIPEGTRDLALTIRGGEPRCTTQGGSCGVYVHYFRMYASLGEDFPILPEEAIAAQQLFGLGNAHGRMLARMEAEPVNTATGNYASHATDLSLPGRGLPFAFTRTYNSLDPSTGTLGPGWSHNYASRLAFEGGGAVRFFAEDGAQYLYQPDGAGGFDAPTATFSALEQLADGSYQITRRDQVRDHFAADGRLLELADRNGNTQMHRNAADLGDRHRRPDRDARIRRERSAVEREWSAESNDHLHV